MMHTQKSKRNQQLRSDPRFNHFHLHANTNMQNGTHR